MTKKDEYAELRVVDKRKFNPDGSLREGARIQDEPAEEKPEEKIPESQIKEKRKISQEETKQKDAKETPPQKEPMTVFLSLVLSLATSAQIALGDAEHPSTGERYVNLEEAQGYIDLLTMLGEKTRGNLTPNEEKLLRSAIYELKLRFVARQQELLTSRS